MLTMTQLILQGDTRNSLRIRTNPLDIGRQGTGAGPRDDSAEADLTECFS